MMATVVVWAERIDYSTAVGDMDPTCEEIGVWEFASDSWEIAVNEAWQFVRANRKPDESWHVSM